MRVQQKTAKEWVVWGASQHRCPLRLASAKNQPPSFIATPSRAASSSRTPLPAWPTFVFSRHPRLRENVSCFYPLLDPKIVTERAFRIAGSGTIAGICFLYSRGPTVVNHLAKNCWTEAVHWDITFQQPTPIYQQTTGGENSSAQILRTLL